MLDKFNFDAHDLDDQNQILASTTQYRKRPDIYVRKQIITMYRFNDVVLNGRRRGHRGVEILVPII